MIKQISFKFARILPLAVAGLILGLFLSQSTTVLAAKRELACGQTFPDSESSNVTCLCPSSSQSLDTPTGEPKMWCCGWAVGTSCFASQEEADNAEEAYSLCRQAGDKKDICSQCAAGGGVWTALGCIPTDADQMIQVFIRIGLLVGGGIATLIILAGSFMLSVSQGDPQKAGEAKEMITAAIIGLIFIIFSVSILQLIGVQILQIPEFGQ